jgi:hypothetical protein
MNIIMKRISNITRTSFNSGFGWVYGFLTDKLTARQERKSEE